MYKINEMLGVELKIDTYRRLTLAHSLTNKN